MEKRDDWPFMPSKMMKDFSGVTSELRIKRWVDQVEKSEVGKLRKTGRYEIIKLPICSTKEFRTYPQKTEVHYRYFMQKSDSIKYVF